MPNTDCFLHVPSERESFNNLTKWIADVRAERGNDVVIMIAGNKTDLSDNRWGCKNVSGCKNVLVHTSFVPILRRRVTIEEGQQKASEEDVLFIECSAKTGYNIKALFKKLATALPNSEPESTVTNDSNCES